MRAWLLLLSCFLACCCAAIAQNLVPNGDFEDKVTCPSSWGQLTLCKGWRSPTLGSPITYFHTCCRTRDCVDMMSEAGDIKPHSGEGYIGFGLGLKRKRKKNYFQYPEIQLASPLRSGVRYRVGMHVLLPREVKYCTNEIGVKFSNGMLITMDDQPLRFESYTHHSVKQTVDLLMTKGAGAK